MLLHMSCRISVVAEPPRRSPKPDISCSPPGTFNVGKATLILQSAPCNLWQRRRLFLRFGASCCEFARRHKVPNVFLQKLVVVVELVVLFLDGLDTIKKDEKRVLQGFGMSEPNFMSVKRSRLSQAAETIPL